MEEGRVMKLKCCFRLYPVVLLLSLALPITAHAQFGGSRARSYSFSRKRRPLPTSPSSFNT